MSKPARQSLIMEVLQLAPAPSQDELRKKLKKHGLTVDIRRYTVSLDHAHYRIAAYFEAGRANVTTADKRTANPGSTALRKRETAESVEDALKVMAQFLADETR